MCGIFALLNHQMYDGEYNLEGTYIHEQFMKGSGRGPDDHQYRHVSLRVLFGFHRLAINGLTKESNQPIQIGSVTLICNGEIYNYKELYESMGIAATTESDCEVIIHCYLRYGIDYTLNILDGVFSFVLVDNNPKNTQLYVARDPYGVRPLYILESGMQNQTIGFASEMKTLVGLIGKIPSKVPYRVNHFPPGCYSIYKLTNKVSSQWTPVIEKSRYFQTAFSSVNQSFTSHLHGSSIQTILKYIKMNLTNAVYKRCSTTERPIACLLSGGLDSSLITALVCSYFPNETIETYSIGMEGSVDLKYAEQVANYLKTKHTNIVISKEEYLAAIPEVIYAIESYDTTTVRASVGNYLVSKYISENSPSNAKVIFNGDGSDELTGGYLYVNHAPNCVDFDYECRSLLRNIHRYDVLRSDKCISSHGLEPRTPFLDRTFTQFYLSIPPQLRYRSGEHDCFDKFKNTEKYLLRAAFDDEDNPLLPHDVLWRTKEAFSDGVCDQTNNISQMIGEHVAKLKDEGKIDENIVYLYNSPQTTEQHYYRSLFEKYYPDQGHIIPKFWMPRFVEASDPSARTLGIYKNDDHLL